MNLAEIVSCTPESLAMGTELRWLLYTALLAGSLWIPYVVGVNVTDFPGKAELFVRPPNLSGMAPWVQRSFRAHANLLEQFLPFATVVLIGVVAGVSTPITEWCVFSFFWLRVAHAVGFISGMARAPVRPILYVAGWLMMLTYAFEVLRHAPSA